MPEYESFFDDKKHSTHVGVIKTEFNSTIISIDFTAMIYCQNAENPMVPAFIIEWVYLLL